MDPSLVLPYLEAVELTWLKTPYALIIDHPNKLLFNKIRRLMSKLNEWDLMKPNPLEKYHYYPKSLTSTIEKGSKLSYNKINHSMVEDNHYLDRVNMIASIMLIYIDIFPFSIVGIHPLLTPPPLLS